MQPLRKILPLDLLSQDETGRRRLASPRLLVEYFFESCLRKYHSYRDVTSVGEWLQNVRHCSALTLSLSREGFLSHGTSVYMVSSKGPPCLVTSTIQEY